MDHSRAVGPLLRPGTSVLGRLSMRAKVVAITVLAALAAGAPVWGLVATSTEVRQFSDLERVGLRYIEPALVLLFALGDAQVAATSGEPVEVDAVRAALAEVDRVDAELGALFQTAAVLDSATQATGAALAAPDGLSGASRWQAALAEVQVLVTTVGDNSNLVLDPDVDSYYLMDSVVFSGPRAVAAAAAQHTALTRAARAGTLGDAERVLEVGVLSGAVAVAAGTVVGDHASTLTATARPDLEERLQPALAAFVDALGPYESASAALVLGEAGVSDAIPAGPLLDALETLVRADADALKDLLDDRVAGLDRTLATLLGITAAVTLVLLYGLAALASSTSTGSRQLLGAIRRVEQGDLTASAGLHRGDELGQLSAGLDASLVALRRTLTAIEGRVQQVQGTASTLLAASGELEQASVRNAADSEQLSAAAEAVDETARYSASGTAELNAAIEEIARAAEEAARVAGEAAEAADDTRAIVERLTSESVAIGEVVELINGITGQTHLLALNATIEAARAGEFGSGFAVVAREVRELSIETSSATSGIHTRVTAIRAGTHETAGSLGRIAEVVNRIMELQTSIAGAVTQQSATTNELASAVDRTAGSTDEINRSVARVRAAAQTTARGAGSTRQAAVELEETAEALSRDLGAFTFR